MLFTMATRKITNGSLSSLKCLVRLLVTMVDYECPNTWSMKNFKIFNFLLFSNVAGKTGSSISIAINSWWRFLVVQILFVLGVESMSLCGFIVLVVVKTYVNMYDLVKFNSSFYSKCVDIQIKCFRPYLDQGKQ